MTKCVGMDIRGFGIDLGVEAPTRLASAHGGGLIDA